MEMYSLHQQRRMERVNPKGLAGLGVPLFYGSSCLGGPAGFQGRGTLPASDLHLHRSTSRHLQGNPILLGNRPHFTECWGQKYRLRRGSVYQKPLESDTESFKNQAEEKDAGQMPVVPCEEEEDSKDPEIEVDNIRKSRETDEKPNWGLANTCIELQPSQTKPSSLEAKARDGGKEKPSEQVCGGHDEKNGLGLSISVLPLPGRCLGSRAGPQQFRVTGSSHCGGNCDSRASYFGLHFHFQTLCLSLSPSFFLEKKGHLFLFMHTGLLPACV